jgi:hypothetical protein
MMAPDSHDTRDPSPTLSPQSVALLRDAMADRWRGTEGSEGRLATVLRRVATEARELGVRPEVLIVTMKGLEAEIVAAGSDEPRHMGLEERRRLRDWLVSTSLKAYFGP